MEYDLDRDDLEIEVACLWTKVLQSPDAETLYDLQALPDDELRSMRDRFRAFLKPHIVGGTESSVSHGAPSRELPVVAWMPVRYRWIGDESDPALLLSFGKLR